MIEWKQIRDGIFVSPEGNIRVAGYISAQNHKIKEKYFIKFIKWDGYSIFYYRNKSYNVHHLVAEAYCQDWFKGCVVHHINKIKTENQYTNLQCFTASDHIKHHRKLEVGTELSKNRYLNFPILRGKDHPLAKAVKQFDLNGNFIQEFDTLSAAGQSLNIGPADICSCCRGKLKTARGFIWKYSKDT